MKIDRLINIIMTLSQRGRISAKELSEKYEVSLKTIQRDIDAIELAGIPIVSYKGKNGGYEIIENYKIVNGVINKKEMDLIYKLLDGLGKSYETNEVENLKNKISIGRNEKFNEGKIYIDFSGWGKSDNTKEKLKRIDRALDEERVIEFTYNNLKNEESRRVVEPIKLIFKSYNWYLYAYCLEKEDYRIFKVRRIKELEVKNIPYSKRGDNFLHIFNDRTEKLIDIKFKCGRDFLKRIDDYFDEYIIIDDESDNKILVVTLPEDEWLYSLFLGFGGSIEVLEPIHFRNSIKNRIEKMVNVYK